MCLRVCDNHTWFMGWEVWQVYLRSFVTADSAKAKAEKYLGRILWDFANTQEFRFDVDRR